jgi:4'-phosphopantetheinyl transferase EntD
MQNRTVARFRTILICFRRKLAELPGFLLLPTHVADMTQTNELQSALQGMIPAGVGAVAAGITVEAEPFEYPEEGQHLASAVVTRRNEFISGRYCARAALVQIGTIPCALPPDADGLPIWPAGSVGSISHSRGLCCAVAASAEDVISLGIDIEKTTRLSPRAMERVVHPLEANFVGGDQALGSLLFSAKEAFYKAQFPVWGAQPNFKDLALQIDVASKQLSVCEVATHLPQPLREAACRMQFHYEFFGDYVVTLCWLNRA